MKRFLSIVLVLCSSAAMADEAKTQATPASAKTTTAAKPLHRHPTLFGMLRRSNDVRRRLGLRPHRINPVLTKAAQDQANYMAQTGQFSHYVNGSPQSRAGKYGFRGGVLENIAYGTRSVSSTFSMWEGSGGHYASIVSGTSDAGFGYAIAPNGQCYWVGMYANPAKGDAAGDTEEQVAAVLEAEKKAMAEAAAKVDPNVAPASATEPVKEDEAPAKVLESAE
jgi:uncharacterized protein YkwD